MIIGLSIPLGMLRIDTASPPRDGPSVPASVACTTDCRRTPIGVGAGPRCWSSSARRGVCRDTPWAGRPLPVVPAIGRAPATWAQPALSIALGFGGFHPLDGGAAICRSRSGLAAHRALDTVRLAPRGGSRWVAQPGSFVVHAADGRHGGARGRVGTAAPRPRGAAAVHDSQRRGDRLDEPAGVGELTQTISRAGNFSSGASTCPVRTVPWRPWLWTRTFAKIWGERGPGGRLRVVPGALLPLISAVGCRAAADLGHRS